MKNIRIIVLLMAGIFMLTACSRKAPDAEEKYTCPMHPAIVKEHAGKCPICGMELVRKNAAKTNVKLSAAIGDLLQAPNKTVVGQTRMAFPVQRSMDIKIEATGVITIDARSVVAVPVRTAGRIERIFIHANLQPVLKGDKILEIYSPDLMNAQQEFLYLLKADPADSTLLMSAKIKLEQAGMDQRQINDLSVTKITSSSVSMYCPADGYVELTASENPTGDFKIREGQYVQKGELIFNIVQSGKLRAEIDFAQPSATSIKTKSPIDLKLNDGTTIHATVDVFQPFLSSGSPFIKVKSNLLVYGLTPGQLVSAVLQFPSGDALWIPRSASLYLGKREIAFLKKGNIYQAKLIQTGRQTGEWVEVLRGIAKVDTLAFESGLMADRDSFIEVSN